MYLWIYPYLAAALTALAFAIMIIRIERMPDPGMHAELRHFARPGPALAAMAAADEAWLAALAGSARQPVP
jgi:hypothetical protein